MVSKLLKNTQKKKKSITIEPDDRVVLKPIFGIPPSVYLCVLYAAILFGGIMLIVSLINRKNPGSYIDVRSVPAHAAIYLDNSYVGSSPKKLLVPPGSHTIQISLLGFTPYHKDIQVKNTVLLQRIRSKRITPVLTTDKTTVTRIVPTTIETIAGYANATSTKKYQIPSTLISQITSLTEASNQYATNNNTTLASMMIRLQSNLIAHSLPYMNTQARVQEVKQAYAMTKQTNATNNINIIIQDEKISRYMADINNKPNNNVPLTWTLSPSNPATQDVSSVPDTIIVSGMSFLKVLPTTLTYREFVVHAGKKNHFTYMEYTSDDNANTTERNTLTIQTPLFYVLSHEITQQEYRTFLQETPQWKTQSFAYVSPDHKNTYLEGFDADNAKASVSMRYITWYDANEFVVWLNKKTQALGYTAMLPNEFEWRAANNTHTTTAQISGNTPDDTRNSNFTGSLWEWTSTWYNPLPQYATYKGPQYGSEKIIMGGSYINKSQYAHSPQDMAITRNAAYDPSWATAYVGFRVILIPNSTQ